MLSASDVRVLDLNSAWHGVPPGVLMQNAGRAVAEVALARFAPARVLVLAGPGNNGGDGAVAARHLADAGIAVTLLYSLDPATLRPGDAANAAAQLDRRRVRVETFRSARRTAELCANADLVLDALLGVGSEGELREPIRTMVRAANQSRRPVLAVDVATGLGGRTQIRPTLTVTLHDRKRGMNPQNSGRILVRDIGIPPAAAEVGPGDLAVNYPRPRADSHKGQNGRLLVVAGGPYCGAPILAARAALRTGCDLVRLYTPDECAEAAAHAPDLIVHHGVDDDRLVPDDADRVAALLPKVDAVLIGPGIGTDRATRDAIATILDSTRRRRTPLVLDADALGMAGASPQLLRGRPVLCTPHPREFRDLTGRAVPKEEKRRPAAVGAAAKRLRSTILLKAPTALIADGRSHTVSRVHPPGLTPGGIGDVLAGASGALVAKGLDPYPAARAASFLVGAAARHAFEAASWGARATDVIEAVPRVLREWVPATPVRPIRSVY